MGIIRQGSISDGRMDHTHQRLMGIRSHSITQALQVWQVDTESFDTCLRPSQTLLPLDPDQRCCGPAIWWLMMVFWSGTRFWSFVPSHAPGMLRPSFPFSLLWVRHNMRSWGLRARCSPVGWLMLMYPYSFSRRAYSPQITPKMCLLEWCRREKLAQPVYETVSYRPRPAALLSALLHPALGSCLAKVWLCPP